MPLSRDSRSWRPPAFGAALGLVALGLVAGCASTSGSSTATTAAAPASRSSGLFGRLFSPNPNKNVVTVAGDNSVRPEDFLAAGYCPPVEIRPGTEALIIYDKGHEGDPESVRYEGSITKTARECHSAGAALMIKVGIAGRLTGGPKVAAGNYQLPIRVAIVKQHGGDIFYSEVTKVPVTVGPPTFGSDFTTVVDNISFEVGPGDRDLIIYIGYDEGKPKVPAPTG